MSSEYKTRSTSNNTADVSDIIISETQITRRILRSEIIKFNHKNSEAGVKISILHQRKIGNSFEDISDRPLSSLKAGEMSKLNMSSEETLKLFKELQSLYAIHSQKDIVYGETKLIVGRDDEIIKADPQRLAVIKQLIDRGHSVELWEQLVEADPDLATKLSNSRIHQSRKAVLVQFSNMLKLEKSEQEWQDFFEENEWIFGYGLNYQILRTVSDQPNYGGERVTGKGKNKGDYLKRTAANIKFTVLVEIKKPNSALLSAKRYRNDTYTIADEVNGGISQLRINAHKWQVEGSNTSGNRDDLESESIFTVQPHKILIIGNTAQLQNRSQRESFELFRRNQKDLDIITFDELLERAKFIVNSLEDQSEPEAFTTDDV